VMNMCCVSWSILLQIVWSFGQIRKCCWQEKKKRSLIVLNRIWQHEVKKNSEAN
jgi:hypothetical protein